MQCLARFGEPEPGAPDDPAGVLPRPRRDHDDPAAGSGAREEEDQGEGDGADETANRLLAQLRAHEAQRPWGSPAARWLGLTGPPWMRAVVGAVAVLVVLLVAMWVLGHLVRS